MKINNPLIIVTALATALVIAFPFLALGDDQIKIKSNPDKVDVAVRSYAPTNPALATAAFRAGLGGGYPELEGYNNQSNVVAVVVEWKIRGGTDIAPRGIGPLIKGISTVPKPFEKALRNGEYHAVGVSVAWRGYFAEMPGGPFVNASLIGPSDGAARTLKLNPSPGWEDTAKFLWFIPKQTKSFALVLPSHKAVEIIADFGN